MDFSAIPSVDKVLRHETSIRLIENYGHKLVTDTVRAILSSVRDKVKDSIDVDSSLTAIVNEASLRLEELNEFSLKPVLNLTGTVLHTNLGRAPLPDEAIEAISLVARRNSNLEFDLKKGKRGDRDDHIEALICDICGAEAATVVNNNAAAVMLTLNTLAMNKEVPVSRGELIEIGGSFRIPEIMSRSGCTLVEVGATNRTHLKDFRSAMNGETALLMKVHTSNYEIKGFTQSVSEPELAELAHEFGIPFVTDLGSGTLTDLTRFGLPHEPTAQEAIKDGADIVTFSGDKLLGGPQSGIIVGKKELIDRIKSNPMKRALRVDKLTIAALHSVIAMYRDPDGLSRKLPALRHLAKSVEEIGVIADAVAPCLAAHLPNYVVTIEDTKSQIGSGSLPLDLLPSRSISISPSQTTGRDAAINQLAASFRQLPMPVIGRINDGRLIFDLRTLDQADDLTGQIHLLNA